MIKLISPILQFMHRKYLAKPRPFDYQGLNVIVSPGVFYPRFTISTRMMLDFLNERDLNGKKVLEIGAGCGIISLLAARKGADVTATDINPLAIIDTRENAKRNNLKLHIIESDLLDKVTDEDFDYIIITPPYYPKNPSNLSEMAWYCGENFEFYQKLFSQLKGRFNNDCLVLMILSQDCRMDRIVEILEQENLYPSFMSMARRFGEWNYIYSIKKKKRNGNVVPETAIFNETGRYADFT